ncbi:hypothetical protein PPO43_06405 [Saprospira sp. CCB-QB6]|uniref:hypothetical protein n=1 Tax=Saprospira sp. CCB-QB6 TaxID=3023936 RepID=UPI00234A40C1|nr:hypothetical protein [Saprospira sp. CCB-QB6]WCL82722.1 hypothetical protein PPO43_06405 [Saprospira sp. CCB-QB6]
MNNNYKIERDLPPLSSEKIAQYQDFDALMGQFEAQTEQTDRTQKELEPKAKTPAAIRYGLGAGMAVLLAILTWWMLPKTTETSEELLNFLPAYENYEEQAPPKLQAVDGDLPKDLRCRSIQEPLAIYQAELLPLAQKEGNFVWPKAIWQLQTNAADLQLEWPEKGSLQLFNFDAASKSWEPMASQEPEAVAAQIEKNFPLPKKPLAPEKLKDNMQVFNVDLNAADFPTLAQYKELLWVAPKSKINGDWFDVNWTDISIQKQDELHYQLELKNKDQKLQLAVQPLIPYTQASQARYQKELAQYEKALAEQEAKRAEALKAAESAAIQESGSWAYGQTAQWQKVLASDKTLDTQNENGEKLALKELIIETEDGLVYRSAGQNPLLPKAKLKNIWGLDAQNQLWQQQANGQFKAIGKLK